MRTHGSAGTGGAIGADKKGQDGSPSFTNSTLRRTHHMEVENLLFVEESSLTSDHAIHFHVMCSSEGTSRFRAGKSPARGTDGSKQVGFLSIF